MRIKTWFHEVFGSKGDFRAVYFWITVPLAILGIIVRFIPSLASHLPTLLLYLPASGFVLGFIVCVSTAFNRASARADAAEQQLRGLSIDLQSVTAGEYVSPEDIGGVKAHHYVVIALPLVVRNHDGGHDSSIELVSCTTNLRSTPCDRVFFETPTIYKNFPEQQSRHRAISAGDIRDLLVTAFFEFPISNTHLAATEVTGELELRDNRKISLTVPFSTSIIKNAVQVANRDPRS